MLNQGFPDQEPGLADPFFDPLSASLASGVGGPDVLLHVGQYSQQLVVLGLAIIELGGVLIPDLIQRRQGGGVDGPLEPRGRGGARERQGGRFRSRIGW